jgi:acyl dehydratase
LIAELQRWAEQVIGKTETFELGAIDPLWAQRYAIAVDDLNPIYFDAEYARGLGHRGIVAPPNYLATLRGPQRSGPTDGDLLEDGLSPSARPPISSLQAMGGGQSLEFHAPVYCGEVVKVERTILDVQEKAGRSGPLITITEKLRYTSASGEPKLTLRNTLLCRWTEP